MNQVKKYVTNPFILYGIIALLLLLNIGSCIYFLNHNEKCDNEPIEPISIDDTSEPVDEEKKMLRVDIKGYVKKPGVYEVEDGAIVNDVIQLAGGLKSSGSTENINLSKKVVDEAMIVISSKTELKKNTSCSTNTTNSVNSTNSTSTPSIENSKENFAIETESFGTSDNNTIENSSTTSSKISLNKATKEELMTLSGIGEKTAEKIIEYRLTQPFNTIEDLKNVSGIGDATFEKIKDYITI